MTVAKKKAAAGTSEKTASYANDSDYSKDYIGDNSGNDLGDYYSNNGGESSRAVLASPIALLQSNTDNNGLPVAPGSEYSGSAYSKDQVGDDSSSNSNGI